MQRGRVTLLLTRGLTGSLVALCPNGRRGVIVDLGPTLSNMVSYSAVSFFLQTRRLILYSSPAQHY